MKNKIEKQKEILWKLHDAKLEYRKVSDKIQHALMIQTQKNPNIEGSDLNLIKAIYTKPTTNIMLNKEKLKCFL